MKQQINNQIKKVILYPYENTYMNIWDWKKRNEMKFTILHVL
jgi:hypothetical protein